MGTHVRRILAALILAATLPFPAAVAALNANVVWEVRQAGNSANGGGFRNNSSQTPPATPSVSGSGTGGTVVAGTYYVVITYTMWTNVETSISGETAVTTTGTTSSITVTHPVDPGSSGTWNIYVATTSGGPYFPQSTLLAVGSNHSITSTPPTSGTQPSGTDRTLSTSPFVTVDNSTITATTAGANSNVITFTGYTPTGADVGNVYHSLTGTNINAGFFEVVAITSTTWTVTGAANLTTAGGAGSALTGRMGGAVDHLSTIAAALTVSNQIVFMKYSATPYTFTTGVTSSGAGALYISGYDTTRRINNTDVNRPIWRAGANSITFYTTTQFHRVANIVIDNPSAFTGLQGMTMGSVIVSRCQFNDISGGTWTLLLNGTGAMAEDCEFVRCGTSGGSLYVNQSGCIVRRCLARSCTVYIRVAGDGCYLEDVVVYNTTGTAGFNQAGGSTGIYKGCVVYGTTASQPGFLAGAGSGGSLVYDRCITYGCSNKGWSFGTGPRGPRLINCRGGNNTNGNYDLTGIQIDQIDGFVSLTADPFTSPSTFDFTLNNTTGGGAACRGLTVNYPVGSTSRPDAGAVQHADSSAFYFVY